jgi:hypothetical protein
MSGLVDVVLIVAVIALVLVRQMRPRRVASGGRWWLLPAVLVLTSVRQHGLFDPHHESLSVALLVGDLVVGIGMGTVWAFTTRIWVDESGVVWCKGTKATLAAWVGGVLLRIGLAAVGAELGVHESNGSTMLALAATLLIRTGLVLWKARELEPAPSVAAAL